MQAQEAKGLVDNVITNFLLDSFFEGIMSMTCAVLLKRLENQGTVQN